MKSGQSMYREGVKHEPVKIKLAIIEGNCIWHREGHKGNCITGNRMHERESDNSMHNCGMWDLACLRLFMKFAINTRSIMLFMITKACSQVMLISHDVSKVTLSVDEGFL